MSVEAFVIAAVVDEGTPKKKLTDTRLAYLSGVFDGEGCVKFYMVTPKNRINPSPRRCLTLGNLDWRLPRLFQYFFGGKISFYQTNGREQAVWRVTGQESDRAAFLLAQHSLAKKFQLEKYLEANQFLRQDRRHLSPEARENLVRVAAEIKDNKWLEGGDWA